MTLKTVLLAIISISGFSVTAFANECNPGSDACIGQYVGFSDSLGEKMVAADYLFFDAKGQPTSHTSLNRDSQVYVKLNDVYFLLEIKPEPNGLGLLKVSVTETLLGDSVIQPEFRILDPKLSEEANRRMISSALKAADEKTSTFQSIIRYILK